MSHQLTELEQRVCLAWRQASTDLGVQFSTPFLAPMVSGDTHVYLGLVHNFGRSAGTVICVLGCACPPLPIDLQAGCFLSILSESYAVYERQLFVETLNDWGWHGPDTLRPEWYSGQPWT